jgi:hypothetical protein
MEMRVVEWKMEGSLKYTAGWNERERKREREREKERERHRTSEESGDVNQKSR